MRLKRIECLLVLAFLSSSAAWAEEKVASQRPTLRAGACEVDITPPVGTYMGGDLCRLRPVEKILDPLYARALVFEGDFQNEEVRLCFVALDLCTVGNEAADEIRELISRRCGFDKRAVMLHLSRDHAGVAFVSKRIDIAHSDIEEVLGHEAMERAGEILKREPEPRWANKKLTAVDIDWLFAAVILDVKRRLQGRSFPYEVQAFRIGDLALVGLIGEPFVEAPLRIKLGSPAKRTFVAHMCNGYVAYIPTRHAFEANNYNSRTRDGRPVRRGANLFLLESEALDKITDTARRALVDLFPED